MVFVFMGKNNRIQPLGLCSQHLLPKIRSRINHHGGGFRLNQYAATQALIACVFGSAYFTLASNDRHTLRGSRSQKSEPNGACL